jgi:hypothetical protein
MTSIRRTLMSTGVAITLGGLAAAVQAEAPSAAAPAKAPNAAAAKAPSAPARPASAGHTQELTLEPAAVDALKRMGAYLRSLKSFEVDAMTTDEDVLEDGQKLQRESKATLLAKVPDRLRVHVSNDRHDRLYLFDGKNFTLSAERVNMYATVKAPATIGQLATKLEDEFGMDLPLVDLFRWGSPQWKAAKLEGAMDVGPSVVGGTTCEQYAFREADIDWQVWIQKGDYPLPRKLVITSMSDTARPQHSAVYTWNLAPSFNEQAFVFEPPPGAERVPLAKDAAAGVAPKEQ